MSDDVSIRALDNIPTLPLYQFSRMIALGRSCQCPHQVRRITGNKSASYFDWLGTPLPGLMAILQRGFNGCFEREDLQISGDRSTVHHREFGFSYRHLFSRIAGSELIEPQALDREYEEKRTKMDMLAQRWVENIVSEPTLFVRHDAMTAAEAQLLIEELTRQAGLNHVELLVVLPPGKPWESPHPHIHVVSGVEMSGPGNWQGDDALWDAVLENFWHGKKRVSSSSLSSVSRRSASYAPLVVFQVPNQIGLGHMNRMGCVASALRELDSDVRSLFVVEGSSHGLLEGMGLPVISFPALQALHSNHGWSKWSKEDRGCLIDSMADSLVDSIAPDLVVYDCFPSVAFVKAAARRGIESILCLRKMKDYPAYMEKGGPKLVLRACHSIIIPHDASEAHLPEILLPRAVFVGPIVKPLPVDPAPLQARMALQGKRVLVITAGGGGHPDTTAFLRLALEAADFLRSSHPDLVTLLIPGPLFRELDQLTLCASTRVLPFDSRFTETCATADIIVAQAGYNSANELAYLGTPTIFVPALRGFDDQFERASQLAASWPHLHSLHHPSPGQIVTLATQLLLTPQPRIRFDVPDGAYLAAGHLLQTLGRL